MSCVAPRKSFSTQMLLRFDIFLFLFTIIIYSAGVSYPQAVGKLPLDVNKLKIDLMSISGHKIYGPKGVGALYVRRRPRVRIEPVMSGGGQER